MASYKINADDALQLNPKTRFALLRFDRRRRRLLLLRAAMIGIVIFIPTMVTIILLDHLFILSDPLRWGLSLIGYAVTILGAWYTGLNRYGNDDLQQLARQLEAADPSVQEDLLSAVELADPNQSNGSAYFRDRLQHSVAARVAKLDLHRLLPLSLIRRWMTIGTSIAVICAIISLIPSLQFARRLGRAALPGFAIQRASQTVIEIVKPNPATGFVAEGDVVAIVADVSGKPADEVTLRWREQNGERGETVMAPRQVSSVDATPNHPSDQPMARRFAANLSFSDRVIDYQLIAGDAVTLWQTLTPLPRPRTKQFHIRYRFPEYSKLEERVETASHGDLQAFVGTKAEVTVTFDQPVENAVVRFVGRDTEFSMEAVDPDKGSYRMTIPIRTHDQYQVDAISMESGLGNPFSPTFSISPVTDVAPTVQWQPDDIRSLLLTPIDVPELAVNIQDDMPLAGAVQEYSVNGQALIQRELSIDPQSREFSHTWDWDLTSLSDRKGQMLRLKPGDVVRTRVIVTDRRGQTGSSQILDILIANEGFDAERHDRFLELTDMARELKQWIQQGNVLSDTLDDRAVAVDINEPDPDQNRIMDAWSAEAERLIGRVSDYLQQSRSATEASNIELLGLAMSDLTRKLVHSATQSGESLPESKGKSTSNGAKTYQQDSQRIMQMVENLVGHDLTLTVATDAVLLQRSLRPVAGPHATIPTSRIPRYLRVAGDRLKAIGQLVERNADMIPQSTRRHFEGDGWLAWSDQWSQRLDQVINGNVKEPTLRRVAKDFHDQLNSRAAHSLVDSRLASTNAKLIDAVRNQIGRLSDSILQTRETGRLVQEKSQSVDREKSPAVRQYLGEEIARLQTRFDTGAAELQKRIHDDADLHRRRPVVDLRYAADLGLLSQAIKTVSSDGYRPYHDIAPEEIYERLADAIDVIQNVHHASRLHRQLESLRDAERDLVDNANSKISHSFWMDQYRIELQSLTKRMQKRKEIKQAVRDLDETRRNKEFNASKNSIDNRRWSNDPSVSAFRSLDVLAKQAGLAIASMQPEVVRAREEILKFVKSLTEQAREAAELAEAAAQRSNANQDADQPQTSSLADQQREAEAAAKETIDRLHDRANTADLTDERQRELAHDADLSAAAIESAMRRAKQTMQDAKGEPDPNARKQDLRQNAETLSELSQTLRHVAEHFDRADQGQDTSRSREALRDAIQQSRLREEADMRQRRAEAIAKAAESDPEEMLRRLESQLKDNKVMQNELSEIASRAMDSALNKLRRASDQEDVLRRSLERSDPAIAELKKRMNTSARAAALRIAGLDAANMDASQRSGDLGRDNSIRQKLDAVRKKLQQAMTDAQSTGGDQALLSEISDITSRLAADLKDTSDMIRQAREDIANDAGKNQPLDGVEHAAQRLRQIDNARRNSLIRSATNEQRVWSSAVRETGPRLQQAQRKQRAAKDAIRKLEQKNSAKDPEDPFQDQLQAANQKLNDANRAVDEIRKTKEFASDMVDESAKRIRQVRIEKPTSPDPKNLINDDVARTLDATANELDSITKQIARWQPGGEDPPTLTASTDESSRLVESQYDVQIDVADAGEDIRRAGRHEQRLEKPELAAAVQEVADTVTEQTVPATEKARRSLEHASEDAAKSADANGDLQAAAEQIDRTAGLLQTLLGGQPDRQTDRQPDRQTAQGPPGDSDESQSLSEEQSRQLAKTLDELDRAMLSSKSPQPAQPPSQQDPQESQSDSASSDSTASSQGQPPSDAQASGTPPQSAGEASPTLASMLEGERQNAARQRRGQKPPSSRSNDSKSNKQGEDPSEGTSSIADMNDPPLDAADIERVGDDWGKLRQQAPEDVLQSEWSTVAPQYRREVSAYFRAIAERSVRETQD